MATGTTATAAKKGSAKQVRPAKASATKVTAKKPTAPRAATKKKAAAAATRAVPSKTQTKNAPARKRIRPTTPPIVVPDQGPTKATRKKLRVAAFGDSLMWGQGLEREGRFSVLAGRAIASQVRARLEIVHDLSRSGAKIVATDDEREAFVNTYPGLFKPRTTERTRFLDGSDERPAARLYGEVPATFPTVRGQVAALSDAAGRTVDVAFVDGGINDISLEDILDPRVRPGDFVSAFDGIVTIVAMVGVMKLLKAVRRKCPNALIMYFGFFPGLSYKSDTGEISDWFKEEYNDDFGWWFNKHIYQVVDVNHLILEALVRSLWLWGRWEYLTKIAVDRINHSDTFRGPGVVYVPSEFTEENSVFAPKPFLWDDPFDPTKDPARQKRVTGNPRDQLLDDIWRVWLKLVAFGVSNEDRENAAVLARRLTGPTDLENDLRRVAAGQMGDAVEDVLAGLAKEAGRIQHTRIASLGHPNVNGARSYATSAAARYKSFVADRAAARTAALPPAATLRLSAIEATLARCALRSPRSPLEADIGRLDVDAFELEVETAETSEVRLVGTLWLVVSTKEAGSARQRMLRITPKYRPFGFPTPMIPVKVTPDLEPGQRSRYMVPAGRRLRLDEIRGTHLLWANDPTKFSQAGRIWTPRRVTLSVVGVDVKDVELRTVKMRPGDTLDLNWPGPEPGFKAPKITDARLRRAKKFTVQPRFLKTSDLSL